MSSNSKVTIGVFPQSGHHYTFVAIDKAILGKYPGIKAKCTQQRDDWTEVNHPWVRIRFAMRDGEHGMWVVIESNLGTIQRGTIHEPRRQLSPAETAQLDTSNTSPYAAPDATHLPDEREIEIKAPAPDNPREWILLAHLNVIWKQPSGHPIDVDLVIDFGNTRTAVLALENGDPNDGKLASVCRPIRFIRDGYDHALPTLGQRDDTASIVDSWFILHETSFASLEPPSEKFRPRMEIESEDVKVGGFLKARTEKRHFGTARAPQMFVELSPVVFGDAARDFLGDLAISAGGNYTMSSPKRFVWDNRKVGDSIQWWTMKLNRWNPRERDRSRLPKLAGSLLRFLPIDGREWHIDAPPNEAVDHMHRPQPRPEEPAYPRADAMSWAGLAILEIAYRQITSEAWREGNQEFVPRRLRNVMVTFPSGWGKEETGLYRSKWQKAINIFTLAHLQDKRSVTEGGDRPELIMSLDEAVASQLPIIYSEIRRLGDVGENWIELYGRGKGTDSRVRVMTVDIGGGTTDISVVEYGDAKQDHGVDLQARLLFRDSSSEAGDNLAKVVIEQVLLPSVGSQIFDDANQRDLFDDLFRRAHSRAGDKAKWSRIVKLVMLPIVRQWLSDLSEGRYGDPELGGGGWAPSRITGSQGALVDEGALRELNELFQATGLPELMDASTPINYAEDHLRLCVQQTFRPLVQSLAKYVAAFEVDLVTLSGKPSELPQVLSLLEDLLPIMPQRILQAKDYAAGDWYPPHLLKTRSRIKDAKSVTVVGGALFQAMKNHQIRDWSITRLPSPSGFPNWWGSMPTPNNPTRFGSVFLRPDDHDGCARMQVGTKIGRKTFESAAKPEQVYRLRWRDGVQVNPQDRNCFLMVTVRREVPENPDELENLVLVAAEGTVGANPVNVTDLELQLCTLEQEEFWVDNGRFEVDWTSSQPISR